LGPILIEGWRESPALGLSFVLGFYLTMIGTFMAFIYLFGTTRHLGPKITRALSGISALALLIFGIYQIGNGIGKIWA
jgi:small neutral amino acid transporter SnatA (MarC family)